MASGEGARARTARHEKSARFLKPADRVRLAVEMSSTAMAITFDSIRDCNPGISKAKFVQLARKRLQSGR